ncbi:MAG: hypothetical protein ACRD3J_04315, partial [Thermoanaerobaculia bacterium]
MSSVRGHHAIFLDASERIVFSPTFIGRVRDQTFAIHPDAERALLVQEHDQLASDISNLTDALPVKINKVRYSQSFDTVQSPRTEAIVDSTTRYATAFTTKLSPPNIMLFSNLFKGDANLAACQINDAAHLTTGASGEHVAKVQFALFALDSSAIDTTEVRLQTYG